MSPMGPGFLIFFQQPGPTGAGGDTSGVTDYDARRERYLREEKRRQAILRDDQETIELIAMLAVSGILDE